MADRPILDDAQRAVMATFKRHGGDVRHAFPAEEVVLDAAQHSGFDAGRLKDAVDRLSGAGLLEWEGSARIKITRQGFLCGVLDLCHVLDENPPDPPL